MQATTRIGFTKIAANLSLLTNKLIASLILLFVAILAFIPWEYFYTTRVNLQLSLAKPTWDHLLGTDQLGRDVLVRLHFALLHSVLPLWALTLLSLVSALLLSSVLLYLQEHWMRARIFVRAAMLIFMTLTSLPIGIVVFGLALFFAEMSVTALYLGLFILFSSKLILQLISSYQEARYLAYWLSHQASGGSFFQRFFAYGVLGRWRYDLLTSLCLNMQVCLGLECSLSYLGFGVQEPQASLGNMLAAHFDLFLFGHDLLFLLVVGLLLLLALVPACFRCLASRLASRIVG